MGDSEKLRELKKAYAEIILNTAKEAAVRVMVAEKKSLRYQRELSDAKEDAVRMMVRLKQMMDSRMYAADRAASCQKSKIEELEAQLHEAEDIVKDLREELAIVRDELDDMKKNRLQRMCEQQANHVVNQRQEESILDCNHIQVSNVQAIHMVTSELENLSDQRINESARNDQCETIHDNNFDKAPKVTLAKELELLRKGSSQILHEHTNGDFSNDDGLHGKSQFVKDDSTVREDSESGKSVTQTLSVEGKVSEGKSHNRVKQVKKSTTEFYLAMKIKPRDHRFKKNKNPSSFIKRQSTAKKILKSLQKTTVFTSKTYPFSVVSSAVSDTDDQGLGVPCKTVELRSYTGLSGRIQPCSQSTPENAKSNLDMASTGKENGSADSSVTCSDLEIACAPSCSIVEESDELDADNAHQPKMDRSIKFTFQRKRKREYMGSGDENDIVIVSRSSDEENFVRQTNLESSDVGNFNSSSETRDSKETNLKELERSLTRMKTSVKRVDVEIPTDTKSKAISIVPKATRDSRRLAQVARQLLSMSEKKCWD